MKVQKSTLLPLATLIIAFLVMLFGNNMCGRWINQDSNEPDKTINFNDSSSGTYIEGDQINYPVLTPQPPPSSDSVINELTRKIGELSKTITSSQKSEKAEIPIVQREAKPTFSEGREEFLNSSYPKIRKVTDNFGNEWNWQKDIFSNGNAKQIYTKKNVLVGQTLKFVVEASDPRGLGLSYRININQKTTGWVQDNELTYKLTEEDEGEKISVGILIRSNGKHRANPSNEADHYVTFHYKILPNG